MRHIALSLSLSIYYSAIFYLILCILKLAPFTLHRITFNQRQAEEILSFSRSAIQDLTTSDLTYGDNLWGSTRLHKSLAGYLNRYFDPAVKVRAEQIITGTFP